MGLGLLIIFIGVPLIEIALFIQIGGIIGVWATIAIVILTAMAGSVLLRIQGLSALAHFQDSVARGEAPIASVFDGFCLLAAGMLLLTPGFFTDILGFLLFTPALRRGLKNYLSHRLHEPNLRNSEPRARPSTSVEPNLAAGDIIDGEFQDITDQDDPERPG